MLRLLYLVAAAVGSCAIHTEQQAVLSQAPEGIIRPINVAIIGAGAAGSSSAYHLSRYAAEAGIPVNITIFERNEYIGGRSTTVNAYDDPHYPVELGASIFVRVNQILVDAVQEFNLSTGAFTSAMRAKIPGAALGVWDGRKFVVTMESENGWWDTAKLLWKYGLAPVRTLNLMKATVAKFLKLYDKPIFPFVSLTQAVQDVELLGVTASTGEQYMLENGITGAFGHDIVQASTRVNYAQNLNRIHGLEAMVCMATDGAMSVEGGNWKIFDQMIQASNASTSLDTTVAEIEKKKDGSYALSFSHSSAVPGKTETDVVATQDFDTVILASPLQFSDLKFTPPLSHEPDTIPYVYLHVTLFTSPYLLSPAFFGLPATQAVPKVILTTTLPDPVEFEVDPIGLFSISLLRPVRNPGTGHPEYLYKIFSQSPPNSTWLAQLLGQHDSADSRATTITWLYRKTWNSYPYELPRVTFEDIQFPWFDDDTAEEAEKNKRRMPWFYTSGIESFISTMETSALMGKNVAALVIDSLKLRAAEAGLNEPDR